MDICSKASDSRLASAFSLAGGTGCAMDRPLCRPIALLDFARRASPQGTRLAFVFSFFVTAMPCRGGTQEKLPSAILRWICRHPPDLGGKNRSGQGPRRNTLFSRDKACTDLSTAARAGGIHGGRSCGPVPRRDERASGFRPAAVLIAKAEPGRSAMRSAAAGAESRYRKSACPSPAPRDLFRAPRYRPGPGRAITKVRGSLRSLRRAGKRLDPQQGVSHGPGDRFHQS